MNEIIIDERVQKICKEFDRAFDDKNLERIKSNLEVAIKLLNDKLDDISKCKLYYSIGTACSDYIQVEN